ncbi:MAG TPA: ATP-binding protein [Pseudogracilibacillus sp.]|nr:ATP-binding protein [Pseudogracilibacillus sp.]
MSRISKWLSSVAPVGFLWRLTFLNIVVIGVVTVISGWAIYHTACSLAAGVGNFDVLRQQQFNRTLFSYLWILVIMAILIGSVLHFYLIKRFIMPIRSLIESTKELGLGRFPKSVKVHRNDEIGQLVFQYNKLIAQLQQNEEQRNRLVTDISHEIRTPLSNLNGYLQALKDGEITGEKDLYASLYKESKRLSQMMEEIEQLTEWDNLSSQSFIKMEETDIKSMLLQCVSMFERTLEQKNIQIKLDIQSSMLDINTSGIQQVINNLLDNAILYYEGNEPITLVGESQDEFYRISITGPSKPIPESEKEKVFIRFYRIDPSRNRTTGGSGLGLAISKEIIDYHQGKIGIDTTPRGNTFWIELPKHKN